jgi:hypothetical protein
MSPLRRAERFERPVNPARVVPGMATSRWNSASESRNPWRGLDGLVRSEAFTAINERLAELTDEVKAAIASK